VKKKKFSTEVILTGRAKSFSDQKVYGFIEIEGGKGCICSPLFYSGGRFKSLKKGDEVEFEICKSQKCPQAANV